MFSSFLLLLVWFGFGFGFLGEEKGGGGGLSVGIPSLLLICSAFFLLFFLFFRFPFPLFMRFGTLLVFFPQKKIPSFLTKVFFINKKPQLKFVTPNNQRPGFPFFNFRLSCHAGRRHRHK